MKVIKYTNVILKTAISKDWVTNQRNREPVIIMFPNRIRVISSPQLNTLLCVHLDPINVIVSYDPSTNTYLEVGFPLRCFQRLSIPDIATGRSGWRQSPHTRGQFTPVLSY